MIVFIFMVVLVAYSVLAIWLGRALYRRTGKAWTWVGASSLLIVAPFYDLIFGYFEFNKFSREHPGVPVSEVHEVDSVLIEGRKLVAPSDGLKGINLPLKIHEFPRESTLAMQPAPQAPVKAYVQFRIVSPADPSCIEVLRDGLRSSEGQRCIGVTSSDLPVSDFAYGQEPDPQVASVVQLNSSRIFPILGMHNYVRDIRRNQVIAETWHMRANVWWFDSPEIPVFAGRNPEGKDASLALTEKRAR